MTLRKMEVKLQLCIPLLACHFTESSHQTEFKSEILHAAL